MVKSLKKVLGKVKYNISGPRNVFIRGITQDSREVKKDYLFVAIKGQIFDGHDFIEEAIEKGAKVIVGEKRPKVKWLNSISYIKVDNSRKALGQIASNWYGKPSQRLKIIGVTGTKGKTTTCHIIHHILTSLGKKVGLISSITAPGLHVTTPDVVQLNKSLKEMVDEGYEYVVIEVSSHGIDQGRVSGVSFEIAALTNIAPEHLDYHKTFSKYQKTKLSFLKEAQVSLITQKGTKLNILPGKFNNLNAQLAVDIVTKLGIDSKDAIKALRSFKLPEGRLEKVNLGQPFDVYIDFAHTPDSLEKVLTYLRNEAKGRLIAVFGCAGERDTAKRPKMAKISTRLADFSVFTAEDPRTEKIEDILAQMEKEIKNSQAKYAKIPERGEAVFYALTKLAKKGDTVVICGKGHEKSMAYDGIEHPWSDSDVVKNVLTARKNIAAVVLAAGLGTRMKSSFSKVLHKIAGKPMLSYTLQTLRAAKIGEIVTVVGYQADLVKKKIGGAVTFAFQKDPKGGTARATLVGLTKVSKDTENVLVLYGDDSAFYSPETIEKVLNIHQEQKGVVTFVTLVKKDPTGLGRIVRDAHGRLLGIVEEKDATEAQRKIKEINDGLYVFKRDWLEKNLSLVRKSSVTGEYYLVNLVAIALKSKEEVNVFKLKDDKQWFGISTRRQLAEAEGKMEEKLKKALEG